MAVSRLATAVGRASGAASAVENGTLEPAVHEVALALIGAQVAEAVDAARKLEASSRGTDAAVGGSEIRTHSRSGGRIWSASPPPPGPGAPPRPRAGSPRRPARNTR